MNPAEIAAVIAALGLGGVIQAILGWFRNRKRDVVDTQKVEVESKLAYLTTVIERLDADNERLIEDRNRMAGELAEEQERSSRLRKRVRELEDELDGVRKSARETENKCDELAKKLRDLIAETDGQQAA